MKNKLLLLTVFCALFFASQSQTNKPLEDSNDIPFNGYVIKIFKNSSQGYGYDIFSRNVIVVHQDTNPYTNSTSGIKLKDDAIKTAKWQIIHLPATNNQQPKPKQNIPVEVARQLNITLN
jgi:hypothetical protein